MGIARWAFECRQKYKVLIRNCLSQSKSLSFRLWEIFLRNFHWTWTEFCSLHIIRPPNKKKLLSPTKDDATRKQFSNYCVKTCSDWWHSGRIFNTVIVYGSFNSLYFHPDRDSCFRFSFWNAPLDRWWKIPNEWRPRFSYIRLSVCGSP